MVPINQIDWLTEREKFSVIKSSAYFMNASTTPLSQDVFAAEQAYLTRLHYIGDPSWSITTPIVDSARALLAQIIGSDKSDNAFGPSTSHNMNLLASAIKGSHGLGNIISIENEFPATCVPWKYHGFTIKEVSVNTDDLTKSIAEKIDSETKAVVISHVQYLNGYKANIEEIGVELKKRSIPFIVNATQSLGISKINVKKAHIAALTCSSYKWLGVGYGASILYTSQEFRKTISWPFAGTLSFDDPEFKGNLTNPKKETAFIELGAPPFMTIVGLEASLRNISRIGVQNIAERIQETTQHLYLRLKQLGIEVITKRDEKPLSESINSSIVSFKVSKPEEIAQKLQENGVLVNVRKGFIRVSCHYYNDLHEVEKLIRLLKER